MAITRWDPFHRVGYVRSARGRFFNEAFGRPFRYVRSNGASAHVLPVDLYEDDNELVVKAQLPGIEQEQLSITAEKGRLTIQTHLNGEAEEKEAKDYRWHYRELWSGDVARTIALPSTVDPDKANATFRSGVLTLTIPKVEAAKPRQVPIKAS